jgi:phosphoribosylaminoimidazolecarboxamide formyltransferase/IMP cyclohydrolase
MKTIRTALISVYHKDGIAEFVKALTELGITNYASRGTASHLASKEVHALDVASMVGGEPILGHRVVTLSREVHAGLLAQYTPEDERELARLGIPYIDLVCVDMYPLEEEIARPGSTLQSVIEQTDIGGPTMIRAAAKGRRIVICDPKDRQPVIDWLKAGQPDEEEFIVKLCAKAEFVVAKYVAASALYHGGNAFDATFGTLVAEGKAENGQQGLSRFYDFGGNYPLAHARFKQIAGIAPGHVNRRDIDRLSQTITHAAAAFDVNFKSVPFLAFGVKHGNACGGAFDNSPAEALRKMLEGDLQAIFGGFVMTNFEIDAELAEILLRHKKPADAKRRKLDGIVAPSFTDEAVEKLRGKSGTCRLFVNPALAKLDKSSLDTGPLRASVSSGQLKQANYLFVLDLDSDLVKVYGGSVSQAQKADLMLGYAICATSNSNTITIVKNGALEGNGVGQQSRVRAGRLAVYNGTDSGHDLSGSLGVSDSFFPFPDGPQVLIDAGVKTIFATSGSVNDQLTIDLCVRNSVTLIMMPDSVARMFFGH